MQKTYEVVNDSFSFNDGHGNDTIVQKGKQFTIDVAELFHRFDHFVSIGYLKLVSEGEKIAEDPPTTAGQTEAEEVEMSPAAEGAEEEDSQSHPDEISVPAETEHHHEASTDEE
jgi:hypothetical protein